MPLDTEERSFLHKLQPHVENNPNSRTDKLLMYSYAKILHGYRPVSLAVAWPLRPQLDENSGPTGTSPVTAAKLNLHRSNYE